MPGSTARAKISKGIRGATAPVSERQQLALLMQMTSDDNQGWTPLHEASNHGWLRVAGALLRAGAHVNVKGWDDDTPLHDAAVNGHFKLVRLLMRHGADPHLRNVRGKTPLDVARQDVVFLMTDTNPFSSDSDSDLLRSDEDDAEGAADRSDRATDGSTTSVSRGAARALVLPRTPPTRRNSTASGAASARGAPAEMRRAPPQNKAVEKPASPRVTLRLHHLKTRDDRKAASKPTERESLSNNRSQLSGNMEGKGSGEDVYEFKSSKEATPVRGASASPEPSSKMNESTNPSDNKERDSKPDAAGEPPHAGGKRNATEMVDGDEGDEETRRKKRKETENPSKENTRNSTPSRSANGRNGSANSDKSKPVPGKVSSNLAGKPNSNQEKNPELKSGTSSGSNSPKPTTSGSAVSSSGSKSVEGDSEDTLGGKGGSETIGPKVPPLKIVIPQQSAALEPEPGTRVGKNGNSRHHQALPYVVASSNSNDSVPEKEGGGSGSASPTDSLDKKDSTLTEDQRSALNHQRVLRSSNRSGNGGANPSGSRSSSPTAGSVGGEDTSPQQSRQQSPAPVENAASSVPETTSAPSPGKSSTTSIAPANVVADEKPGQTEASTLPPQSTPTPATQTSSMELHPRKRKLKPHREQPPAPAPSTGNSESTEPPYTSTEVHPHEQPITNCYQLFLNIRKQIERRRKNLFPVQPKPPQGFKDYLMNRCTYVLTSNASTRIAAPNSPPASLIGGLRDLFVDQEKERQKLKMQHIIEKEKLVLSVEQEILRVHGRAARALANQALPFSACSILKDEEVYNVITPEQEEKDRNARSRYNGRLFLSWLQDVDDKWEKIKESMLLRHHNEAESLHAVQRMDWDWKMKEVGPCEDCPPVPMVHVSDDFDLLPA
ncbi:ankyrin repeat domain-containing protein 11 isoform X2 [Frankliniella occidentalis]|uniref:Ankyrin repeat domain-containing protein 11 isoform X2 n=1 Tax=Frankliniella occidentalis TaxID=133901 RepID=A0A9C6WMC1_FRAOC|nr:ankyrin repeat domain-containing protein 11 isoform X2 [Frankliniella occidentalis]